MRQGNLSGGVENVGNILSICENWTGVVSCMGSQALEGIAGCSITTRIRTPRAEEGEERACRSRLSTPFKGCGYKCAELQLIPGLKTKTNGKIAE
jgi:hypothetical protein